MAHIKNILFDLGGVIIDLDIPRTINEFEKLGIADFEKNYHQLTQTPLFEQFDKGLISEHDFFNCLKKQLALKHPLHLLEQAWNAMLLDFPEHRLEHLKAYKENYNTFLLSNTNTTHIRAFEKKLSDAHSVENLSPFFMKDYYSCKLHLRKPDKKIFEFVLHENNLKPEETLFIDDTLINVQAAQDMGINAVFLAKGEEFKNLLDTLLD